MSHRPPFALISGDRFNISLASALSFLLAIAQDAKSLPPLLRWNLRTFVMWNLAFCTTRVALRQRQWDPFLAVQAMGIFLGSRTGLCQGIDDGVRKKIALLGLPLSRRTFVVADHCLHTLPALVLVGTLVRRRERIPRIVSVYAIMLASWFSVRQQGSLHLAPIPVPHPFYRTWLALLTAELLTPALVDALIARSARRTAPLLLALLAPYLAARIDPQLRSKYASEALCARAQSDAADTPSGAMRLPRSASQPARVRPLPDTSPPRSPPPFDG